MNTGINMAGLVIQSVRDSSGNPFLSASAKKIGTDSPVRRPGVHAPRYYYNFLGLKYTIFSGNFFQFNPCFCPG